jgi:paired amphipathic helix protein Sin3a
MSNLRGDPNYAPGSLTSQTPNRDVKMPPLGNFNVKDSAKEGKKRRTGPGAPTLGGSSVGPAGGVDAARMVDSQTGRGQVLPAGNANKVSSATFRSYLSICMDTTSLSFSFGYSIVAP